MHQVDIVKTLVDVFKLSTDEAERAILLAARVEEHSEVSLLEHWIATHDSVGEIAARVWYLWTWHREDLSATF